MPEVEGSKPSKKKFKAYPIGYFHIDIAEVQTAEGKLYLHVAIDRTSKLAFVQLVRKTGRTSASAFLEALIAAVPYKIHTVLTDNGIQFTFPPRYADGPTARYATHMFDMRCRENGIEHRLTKIKHPWTNGQVERMNRTIKEATVQRYHYDRHDQLEAHLADFINAYNYARRLKTLKGLTPYEYICKCWTSQPNNQTRTRTLFLPVELAFFARGDGSKERPDRRDLACGARSSSNRNDARRARKRGVARTSARRSRAMTRNPADASAAAGHYRAAGVIAGELAMRPLEMESHFGLGAVARLEGREEEAQSEFQSALELAEDMSIEPLANKARQHLNAMSSERSAGPRATSKLQ